MKECMLMNIMKKIVDLNIFAKGYTPNWSGKIFIVNKINDTVPYTYNLKDLNDEEIVGSFYDQELQKSIL